MTNIKDKNDCKDEALATAQAILTITQSSRYQELLTAFENEEKQKVKTILKDIGVKQRIITKMLENDNIWSASSVSFRWI